MKRLLILIYCNLIFKFKLFVQAQNFYLFRNMTKYFYAFQFNGWVYFSAEYILADPLFLVVQTF